MKLEIDLLKSDQLQGFVKSLIHNSRSLNNLDVHALCLFLSKQTNSWLVIQWMGFKGTTI